MNQNNVNKNVFKFDSRKELVVDVADKVINIPLDDENIAKQQKAMVKFRENYQLLEKMADESDFDKMSEKEVDELAALQTKVAKDLVTEILGEDEYERLYKLSGKSTVNMMSVVYFLVELITRETNDYADGVKGKYLSNVKSGEV